MYLDFLIQIYFTRKLHYYKVSNVRWNYQPWNIVSYSKEIFPFHSWTMFELPFSKIQIFLLAGIYNFLGGW